MIAPSNSVPRPVLMVVGENAFQMIVSQMFVAMNNEIPDPKPYLRQHILSRAQGENRGSGTERTRDIATSIKTKTTPAW